LFLRAARGFRGDVLIALALGAAACGAPLMKLPAGPGAPAADAADALTRATAACRDVRTLTAEIAASGTVNGQRFRARFSAGVAAPASARLEAVAPFGAPAFILVADNDDATLLLPREDRVLQHRRSAEVLDAVAGVPLSAADLRTVLTGCAPVLSQAEGRELGADWRLLTVAGGVVESVYIHRASAGQAWLLAAVHHGPWTVEYRDYVNGLPRSMRVRSRPAGDLAGGRSFDLMLGLSQVETNVPFGADVFRVTIPASAQPITLEELRRARPGTGKN
jgi:hypothetical protein